MSNQNYDNDPIERFFRKKANEYDIQYREEDWLKLENRLDKADQQLAKRRWRQMAAAAVALLFGVLAFFTYQQQIKINELSAQLSNSENVTDLSDNFAGMIPDETNTEDSESGERDANIEEEMGNEQDDGETPSASTEELTPVADEPSQDDGESEIRNSLQRITSADFEDDNLASIARMSSGFDGRTPALAVIRPINNKQVTSGTARPSQDQNRELTSMADQAETINAQQGMSRFSVGLQLGPDISTVSNLSDFAKPGHKIGLSIEYDITKNLALTTGAQYSKVRYVGSGSEYRLPEGYLPYGSAPGQMKGVCLLIDIPVSLKYDFLHFHGSRIFASAGLSSYIMLNEDYQLTYEDNQSVLTRRWQEQTGTRHWMSNGTLSVGYELDLNDNISIRAEPFLKVPIKEVGWGNVDLYSMGSFFSINYKW